MSYGAPDAASANQANSFAACHQIKSASRSDLLSRRRAAIKALIRAIVARIGLFISEKNSLLLIKYRRAEQDERRHHED
jgi:trehalose-6-phosphatase